MPGVFSKNLSIPLPVTQQLHRLSFLTFPLRRRWIVLFLFAALCSIQFAWKAGLFEPSEPIPSIPKQPIEPAIDEGEIYVQTPLPPLAADILPQRIHADRKPLPVIAQKHPQPNSQHTVRSKPVELHPFYDLIPPDYHGICLRPRTEPAPDKYGADVGKAYSWIWEAYARSTVDIEPMSLSNDPGDTRPARGKDGYLDAVYCSQRYGLGMVWTWRHRGTEMCKNPCADVSIRSGYLVTPPDALLDRQSIVAKKAQMESDGSKSESFTIDEPIDKTHPPADTGITCYEIHVDIPERLCHARNIVIDLDKVVEPQGGGGLDIWPEKDAVITSGSCKLKEEFWNEDEWGFGGAKWLFDGATREQSMEDVQCDAWIDHDVLMIGRYDNNNVYHAHQDWMQAFLALSILDWSSATTEAIILDADAGGNDRFKAIWPVAFSGLSPKPASTEYRTIRDIAREYRAQGKRKLCLRSAAFGVHAGVTLYSRERGRPSTCEESTVLKAFADFMLYHNNLPVLFSNDLGKAVQRPVYPLHELSIDANAETISPLGGNANSIANPFIITYISRRGVERTIANEGYLISQLRESLMSTFESLDYPRPWLLRQLDFASLPTISSQMAIVRESDIVISAHGSALVYSTYQRATGALVELQHPTRRNNYQFYNIQRLMGRYYDVFVHDGEAASEDLGIERSTISEKNGPVGIIANILPSGEGSDNGIEPGDLTDEVRQADGSLASFLGRNQAEEEESTRMVLGLSEFVMIGNQLICGRLVGGKDGTGDDSTRGGTSDIGKLLQTHSFRDSLDIDEYKVILGYDFGTTFTGCSYAYYQNEEIVDITKWPRSSAHYYPKTPTLTVYKKSDPTKVVAWGNAAKYIMARPDSKNHIQLSKFKLNLDESLHRPPLENGITVVDGIADYLREFHAHVVSEISRGFAGNYTASQFRYCLTVPAMWSDKAKTSMRQAAIKAGMISASDHPDRLQLISEPEAAALYCQKNCENIDLHSGDRFMICDAGGGTVDLIVFQMDGEGQRRSLKEITKGAGESCGSVFLDERFRDMLKRKFGDQFSNISQSAMDNMLDQFINQIKPEFDGMEDHYLQLPASVELADRNDENIGLEEGVLKLPADELNEQVFDPIVNQVLQLIEDQLRQVTDKQLSAIFLVGGFGSSNLLYHRVKSRFSSRVPQILTPPRAGMAVVRGAVLFGLNPRVVTSRISRRTYGINAGLPFDPRLDPPASKVQRADGSLKCTTRFLEFTRKGDSIPVDHCVRQDMHIYYGTSPSTDVILYATQADSVPRYYTDPGVSKVASIEIPIPEMPGIMYQQRISYTVRMYFGLTEIRMEAEFPGGQVYSVTGDFDAIDSFS
ncbi:hypothetical protein BZG36_02962 [Bifiguratus adelaidae]|uniref:Uncharacterized protein n=1 Tax=Bifiguratus adelaidae TaxID=1938954 RepID=A0A261Y0T5_9FUNG|nr:hypothetical protein BZG36_02962 [Bifiguratus adelaidae]